MTAVHVLGLRAKFHCGTLTQFGLTTSSLHHLGSKLSLTNYSGKGDTVHHKFSDIYKGSWTFNSHFALSTNSSIFLLLGLTVTYKDFFKLKLLIIFSLVEGEAVAVSARNRTCFGKKDLISPTRPHHFLKGSFSSFFSPLNKKKTWT